MPPAVDDQHLIEALASERTLRLDGVEPSVITALARLLVAGGLGNLEHLRFVGQAIERAARVAPWLFEACAARLGVELQPLLNAFYRLDRHPPKAHGLDFVGLHRPLAVMMAERLDWAQLHVLRALYLLLRVAHIQDADTAPAPSHLNRLGQLIRRIDQRGGLLDPEARFQCLAHIDTLPELVEAMEPIIVLHGSKDLQRGWRIALKPWLAGESLAQRRRLSVNRASRPRRRLALRLVSVETPGEEEPLEELDVSTPAVEVLSREAAPAPRRLAAAYRGQATRSENHDLRLDHHEVATAEEVAMVKARLGALIDKGEATHAELAHGLVVALTLDTGRELDSLLAAGIGSPRAGDPDPRLWLDHRRGLLHLPVIELEDRFTPPAEARDCHEPSGSSFRLPLSDRTQRLLERLASPAGTRIGQLTGPIGPHDCAAALLAECRTRLPRLRKWAACRLQTMGEDLCATQLICGDTFGRPTAPLYYYAPRESDLVKLYRAAMLGPTANAEPEVEELQGGRGRIGPATLIAEGWLINGIIQCALRLNVSRTRIRRAMGAVIDYHNRLTDYLVYAFALLTSHRRNRHLYALSRLQLDLANGLAVLRDKTTDTAHLSRVVALPERLTKSLADYAAHARWLAAQPWAEDELRDWGERHRKGQEAFFFFLDARGLPRHGSLGDWDAALPPAWRGGTEDSQDSGAGFGARSWHRARLCMALREAGAPAIAAHHQLGHLELAGYPGTDAGLLAPLELLEATRPALALLETQWCLRRAQGLADPGGVREPDALEAPLRLDWHEREAAHRKANRIARAKTLLALRSAKGQERQAAADWLEKTITEHFPPLASLRRPGGGKRSCPLVPAAAANAAVTKLLDLVERALADRPALKLAVTDLLRVRVGRAIAAGEPFAPLAPVQRALERPSSAVLPEAAFACEQITRLRRHWRDRLADTRRHAADALGLRALALVFEGGLTDPVELEAIARGRHTPVRLAESDAEAYVQATPERPPVVLSPATNRLLAAIAPPTEDPRPLGIALQAVLPPGWAREDPNETLAYLMKTREVAAAIELPGFVREAMSGAAVSAGLDDLAALRRGQLSLRSTDAVPIAGPDSEQVAEPRRARPLELGVEARRGYRAIIDAISGCRGRGMKDRARTLEAVEAALDAVVGREQQRSPALTALRALASFALSLAREGTRERRHPAVSTVQAYVSAIGRELLAVFGRSDLLALEVEDFTDTYTLLAEALRDKQSSARALRCLEDFHAHLVERYGVQQVPMVQLGPGAEALGIPRLLSDADYRAACAWLDAKLDEGQVHSLAEAPQRRALAAARVVLMLLRYTGARISEIAWLQLREVDERGEALYLSIRDSCFRWLKTAAARRRLPLHELLPADALARVRNWYRAERRRLSEEGMPLLFSEFGAPQRGIGPAALRSMIQQAFREGAGITMHPHELRHLFASTQARELWVAPAMEPSSLSLVQRQLRRGQLPASLGHASASTTLRHYVHDLAGLRRWAASATASEIARRRAGCRACGAGQVPPAARPTVLRCSAGRGPDRAAGAAIGALAFACPAPADPDIRPSPQATCDSL